MDHPNLGGNAFFLACHGALIVPQIYLGIRYKTWGFLFGMSSGHFLEILGYVARVQMHFGMGRYLLYIVTLTIGPAFFSAAIYLCLARIISVYGRHFSRFKPRTYTITFMISDFIALVFQAGGGGILGGNDVSQSQLNVGLAIIKTGLGAHLAATSIFALLSAEFAYRVYQNQDQWNPKFSDLQQSRKFQSSLIALAIATLCILIRTSFRVAELGSGFDSKLANNEVAFMILEGAVIVVAGSFLAVGHPGVAFSGHWEEADFQIRSKDEDHGFQRTDSTSIGLAYL
ncbi:Fc.00g106100.m01.CDS01 [Cosmosporella sp. VM-42]